MFSEAYISKALFTSSKHHVVVGGVVDVGVVERTVTVWYSIGVIVVVCHVQDA